MISKVLVEYGVFCSNKCALCYLIILFFFSTLVIDVWVALIWRSGVATWILSYVCSSPPADLFITSRLSLVILPTTLLYNQFVFSTSVNKFVIRKHSYVYMLICVILFWNPCLTCLCDNNKQHIIIFSLNNYKSPREALLKILIIYNLPSSLHWVQWSLL